MRVLIAKPGLDGHDRGAKVIAMALRDAGVEVIYLGLRQTAESILRAAADEDVDVVAISVLSGTHESVVSRLLEGRAAFGVEQIPIAVGGTIPPRDAERLTRQGVAVFPVGQHSLEQIVEEIGALGAGHQDAGDQTRVGKPGGRSGPLESDASGEREIRTASGIPVKAVYCRSDVPDADERLGLPGHPPFTRGPYESMYRGQLWTMRQYAGYGSASDTNERYHYLLAQGQTALSVAYDLPTQIGYDSDAELAQGEVGRVGVAIDTVEDMSDLFEGLPLEALSVNHTINATSPIILAFYLVAAERKGIGPAQLAGTLQNDILKEFLARKTFIYPPAPSMRLVADVIEFCSHNLPRFNPISITGYHAREAGCDAIQELGLTMASAIAYAGELLGRGLAFDSFAPRLSFHFATTLDLFEEVAKLRAARRLWYRIATERFGARDERSGRLRFFSGTSGATLTAQQPYNNVVRSTIQCLAAVLGGAQSIHTMGYDEALGIPSEDAVRLALRTQQVIAYESGVTRTIDPLGGSYFLESLTTELESRADEVIGVIDDMGGLISALSSGEPQRWIAKSAYAHERRLITGEEVKVGVNRYQQDAAPEEVAVFEPDPEAHQRQVERLQEHRRSRDGGAVVRSLRAVAAAVERHDNVMPSLVVAARTGATLGEMADVFREAFGEYREPPPW